MAVPSDSRFKFTPFINHKLSDGSTVETFGFWVPPDFFVDPGLSITNYTVPNGRAGRVDQISQDVYNTTEYFWVIIAYNRPANPLNWPKAGDIIQIPSIAAIASTM
jgi:hypothetical protein